MLFGNPERFSLLSTGSLLYMTHGGRHLNVLLSRIEAVQSQPTRAAK
jgi:hypothetical protein